jgi:hypothetical protein
MLPALANQFQTNPVTDCDSITVQLYNSSVVSPLPVADYTTTAVLHVDGTATATFASAITGNYYIAIRSRNALLTFSAAPVAMGPTVSYNFTTSASQAYGSNQVQLAPGIFALYSGDVNGDENIDPLDEAIVDVDLTEFVSGYLYDISNTNYPGVIPSDLTGDGNVDLLDAGYIQTNLSNFVFSAHP